jgi:hypothetical protein
VKPIVLAAVMSVVCARPGVAQDAVPEAEPIHAVLRNGGKATLLTSLATYGGHDDTMVERRDADARDLRTSDGNYAGASAALLWGRPAGRTLLSAAASTDLRYYSRTGSVSGLTARSGSGSFGLSTPTGRRTTLRVTQSLEVSSFYQFDPFSGLAFTNPDQLLLPTADYRVDRSRTYISNTSASLDSQVGRYSNLTFDHSTRYVKFPGELLTYLAHAQGVRFQRRVRPSWSFNAGYGYDFSSRDDARGGRYHRVDLGLSYGARLPFSRNTFVGVSTGAALVTTRETADASSANVPLLTVSSSLRHQISRRWSTQLAYNRAPHVGELYRDPTYGDTLFASLAGAPARRLQISISSGYSHERLDAGRGKLASQTIFGSASLNVRLTRLLYAYTQYARYHFQTGDAESLVAPHRNIERSSIRAGVNWRLPLFSPIPEP